jgi:hypothetical protein
MQKQLDLKFYSALRLEGPMIVKSVAHAGRYVNNVRVALLTDLSPLLLKLIRNSYILL